MIARIRREISIPLADGDASFFSFEGLQDDKEHIALGLGAWRENALPLVRIHSECLTGDLFASCLCDCGAQLAEGKRRLREAGGILLYLRQEGRGIGLYNKLDAYALQRAGLDTFEANRKLGLSDDARDFAVAAQMLKALGKTRVRLLSNNPEKAASLTQLGVTVEEHVRTGTFVNEQNRAYLRAKAQKKKHAIDWEKK